MTTTRLFHALAIALVLAGTATTTLDMATDTAEAGMRCTYARGGC